MADAAGELNSAQLTGVLDSIYLARGGTGGRAVAALGMALPPSSPAFRSLLSVRFIEVLIRTVATFRADQRSFLARR
jgi:hypothetical protein